MPIKEPFIKNPFYKNLNSSGWTYINYTAITQGTTSIVKNYCSIN
jgi:hypothetical protein